MFVNWADPRFGFQGWALVGSPGSPIWTLERSREGSGSLFLLLTFSPPPDLTDLGNLLEQKLGFLSGSFFPILGIGETWGPGMPRPLPCPLWWGVGSGGIAAIMSVLLSLLPLEPGNALYSGA